LQELVSAWWRGEIVGKSDASRLVLLRGMFKLTSNRGLFFVVAGNDGPPKITTRAHGIDPDGIMGVKYRPRIHVTYAGPSSWTEDSCTEAFESLARASLFEDYLLLLPPLSAIELTRAEFMSWASRRRYDLPTFWGQQPPAAAEAK